MVLVASKRNSSSRFALLWAENIIKKMCIRDRAGALYACNFYVVKPDLFTWTKSVDILILVVFGGMGSFTGSVLAAIVIGFINMFLQQFADIRMIIYGAALVLIMVFRPQGIFGTKEFTFSAILKRFQRKKEAKRCV